MLGLLIEWPCTLVSSGSVLEASEPFYIHRKMCQCNGGGRSIIGRRCYAICRLRAQPSSSCLCDFSWSGCCLWTVDLGLWTLDLNNKLQLNVTLALLKCAMRASICSTSQLDSIHHAPGVVHAKRVLVRVRSSSLLWLSGRILLSTLRRAPAARLLGLLWPLGLLELLWLLVLLLLLIRAMSICTTAAPTTSVLGATAPTTTITTTRASAILPPATTTTLLLGVRRDHRPPSRQCHLQARSPLVNSGQVELEWFP